MKRFALCAVLTAILIAPVVDADEPRPDIFIPKLRHDFGKVFERDSYEYAFVVRNRGNADLLIENVKPG